MLKCLCFVCFILISSAGVQSPSQATLVLSLKTLHKTLTGCREAYSRPVFGTTRPLLREVVGADGYDKDTKSLETADKLATFLVQHPDQISGKVLIAILSTSDDFSVGIGSSRVELISGLETNKFKAKGISAEALLVADASLNDCQKSLFNAGDDYVELVMNYVGAEEEVLALKHSDPQTKH